MVIVTLQYRLAALGFLAVGDILGGFGVLDQRLALQWVQENIANFGGNPGQVTLFGQSAGMHIILPMHVSSITLQILGATSVAFHLVSPDSWPYFNYAIMESDPAGLATLSFEGDMCIVSTVSLYCLADYTQRSQLLANALGCPTANLSCLQAVSADALLAAQNSAYVLDFYVPDHPESYNWSPYVDGGLLTDSVSRYT